MKKLLTIIFTLFTLSCLGQSGITVYVPLSTAFVSPATNRTVDITPMSAPTINSGSVVLPGAVQQVSDVNGNVIITNAIVGNLYAFKVFAPPALGQFQILIPTNAIVGSNNGSSWLVANSTATFPAGTVAWSAAASDLRYAATGTAGNTNAIISTNTTPQSIAGGLSISNNAAVIGAGNNTPALTISNAPGSGNDFISADNGAGGTFSVNHNGNVTASGIFSGNASGLTGVIWGNIASAPFSATFVSLGGSDVSGKAHDINHPFQTISNACYAAHLVQNGLTPELVQVLDAGPYTNYECNFGWPYVSVVGNFSLYFEPYYHVSGGVTNTDTNCFPLMTDVTGHGSGPFVLDCGMGDISYSAGTNLIGGTAENPGEPDELGFIYDFGSSNCLGAFVFTNSASSLYLHGRNLYYTYLYGDGGGALGSHLSQPNGVAISPACFNTLNGTYADITFSQVIDPYCNLSGTGMSSTNPLYCLSCDPNFPGQAIYYASTAFLNQWGAGEMHFTAKHVGPFGGINALWWHSDLVATNFFAQEQHIFWTVDRNDNKIYSTAFTNLNVIGLSSNQVSWISEKLQIGSFVLESGRNYVVCDKVQATGGTAGFEVADVGIPTLPVYCWYTFQKVTDANGQGFGSFSGTNCFVWANVQHYEDISGSSGTQGLVNNGANVFIQGGQLNKFDGIGVVNTSGTMEIDNMTIDTSKGTHTTDNGVIVNGGTLKLRDVTIVVPTNTQCITAGTAQSVQALAVYFNHTNNANVTLSPSVNCFTNTAIH